MPLFERLETLEKAADIRAVTRLLVKRPLPSATAAQAIPVPPIAVDQSTQDLRVAWRELHRSGPPQGLSRDLLIRGLAHRLQEQTDGGTSRAQRGRLQALAREFEKGSGS